MTRIVIPERIPGLNGNDGLMREHFRAAAKRKQDYEWYVLEQAGNVAHPGPVRITYTCKRLVLMDWDNHCASFKHIGDALVSAGVIIDDKPSIVVEFIPKQIKVKHRHEQAAEIIIEDL